MTTILQVKTKKEFEMSPTDVFSNFTPDKFNDTMEIYVHTITGTKELYGKIKDLLAPPTGHFLDVNNVWYTDKLLVQSIVSTSDPANELVIKRNIIPNDTYTFLEYDHKTDTNDFTYVSLNADDIYDIIKSQYVHKGVYAQEDGKMIDVELLFQPHEYIGTLHIKENETIGHVKYINSQLIAGDCKEGEDASEKISKILEENKDITHIYSQHDVGFGILTCVTEIFGFGENDNMKKLIGCDIWGNCYVAISDNNNHTSHMLNLSVDEMNKLVANYTKLDVSNHNTEDRFCNPHVEINKL